METYKKIKPAKRKREYLPLSYSIRKSREASLFAVIAAISAMQGAIQVATIQSQRLAHPLDKMSKALNIVESITNTANAIADSSKKLQKFY